jgi:hypothetical protein
MPLSRRLAVLKEIEWYFLGFLAVMSLGLGTVGFAEYYRTSGQATGPLDWLYQSIQLFVLESGSLLGPKSWKLEVARFLAPAALGMTAIKALAVIFARQIETLRARRLRGHVVVCGLGRQGLRIAQAARALGHRVAALESDENNDHIAIARDRGILVLTGNAASAEMLEKVRAGEAKFVVVVCGDDGTNAAVAIQARQAAGRLPGETLSCLVQIADPYFCNLLVEQNLESARRARFRLEFFNVFDLAVRSLLQAQPPFPAGTATPGRPHLLVIGLGRMGESLLVQLARRWRDARGDDPSLLPITVVDPDAEARRDLIFLRNPAVKRLCSLEAVRMDAAHPAFSSRTFWPFWSSTGRPRRSMCAWTTTRYPCRQDWSCPGGWPAASLSPSAWRRSRAWPRSWAVSNRSPTTFPRCAFSACSS